jgi:Putative transposase/Transposase zinc-binding domain
MRMPEELERQYVADSLVAAGVFIPTGQGKTPDLPPPELPAKIPIPLNKLLGLKTPSTPPVIELPKVNPENDTSGTAEASCDQTCPCRSESKYEVADIFNFYGDEYRQNHKLTTDQLNVMYAICHCRTAEYGFHADVCDNCGHIETAYNSCRNRHCPKCQGIAKRKWVKARLDELLPVAYHHATFTLPNALSVLSLYNQKLIYDLLFNAASQTLLVFGDDPEWLGAKTGFYGILHTWSQTLWPHVHLHFIVPAGGLTDDGKWIEPKYKGKFLFPVPALSKVFRGKFIEGLKKAYYAGELVLPDNLNIKDDDEFEQWIDLLVSKNWVVNSKPPFSGPEEVVRYIGRYTHRIAISNHRILSIADGQICFSYKDNKEKDKTKIWKEMTLPADQFIKGFLWHVLPKRYHRIRHYGFLNNGEKHANLETIREFFKTQESVEAFAEVITTDDADGITCPKCEKGRLRPFLVTDRYNQILKFDISVFLKKEVRDTS